MSQKVYRGVPVDDADKPADDHHNREHLTYRGVDHDGDESEKAAQSVDSGQRKVYRGVVQEGDRDNLHEDDADK